MKKMKKLLSIMLTLAMVLAMNVTTFAAGSAGTDTTLTLPSNAGHTYNIYQIFTGDLSTNDSNQKVLSNLAWGSNAADKTATISTAVDALKGISATATDKEKLAVIETFVNLDNPFISNAAAGSEQTVKTGYYLVQDAAYDAESTADADKAYSLDVVQVVGPTTIERKADVPAVEKKVYDEVKGFQDGSDYDIGDVIPYKLTATLGDTSDYSAYYVQFDDQFCEGLEYQNDARVFVVPAGKTVANTVTGAVGTDTTNAIIDAIMAANGVEVETNDTGIGGFKITTSSSATDDGYTSTMFATSNDVKSLKDIDGNAITVEDGTQIIVVYSAELTKDATLEAGNFNEVKLVYSNNPNEDYDGKTPDEPKGKDKTPEDKVGVFTYKLEITKKDGDGKELKGADFTLYQKNAEGKYVAVSTDLKSAVDENTVTFTWTGIDAGEYKLEETKTPAGYNTIDPVTFTITPTYENDNVTVDEAERTGLEVTTSDTASFDTNEKTGIISTTITNQKGSVLPSTGGIGTTIFYIVGACLVIGAGVVLVARKRVER